MIVRISVLLAALVMSSQLVADQVVADKHINNAKLVGESRLKVFFWSVFDAQLYAQDAKFDAEQPFALSLSYLRDIKGTEIVAKSIEEMQAQNEYSQAELAKWEAQLASIIPDVDSTTTITGVRDETGSTRFYENGKSTGLIEDERFTQGFFNIWLGATTSEPKLRSELLNLK